MKDRLSTSSVTYPSSCRDDAQKKIADVLDDMDKRQRPGMQNISRQDGALLRLLVESINAKHVLEIGTSNGYSAIWLCLGLHRTDGRLPFYSGKEYSPAASAIYGDEIIRS